MSRTSTESLIREPHYKAMMRTSTTLLLCFMASGFCSCLDSSNCVKYGSKDLHKHASVVEELRAFTGQHIERGIAAFTEGMSEVFSGDQNCFRTVEGKRYRKGCCVLYSNVGYALLTDKYGIGGGNGRGELVQEGIVYGEEQGGQMEADSGLDVSQGESIRWCQVS